MRLRGHLGWVGAVRMDSRRPHQVGGNICKVPSSSGHLHPGELSPASGVHAAHARGGLHAPARPHCLHPSHRPPGGSLRFGSESPAGSGPAALEATCQMTPTFEAAPHPGLMRPLPCQPFLGSLPKATIYSRVLVAGPFPGDPVRTVICFGTSCSCLLCPLQDFSGHRLPVATFRSCGPEPLDGLTLCPQKGPTRRIKLTSRVRAPATLQAGSEKDGAEEEDDEEDTDDDDSFQPYIAPPPFLEQEHQAPGQPEEGVRIQGCPAWDSSDGSWACTVGSSPEDGTGSSGYLGKEGLGQDSCQDPLLLPKLSKDLGSLQELQRDDLSSWASWGSLSPSPRLKLVPGEPLVSFQTLTFGWDSGTEEGEEEEEEGGSESELGYSSSGSWGTDSLRGTDSLQRTEGRSRTLGHYMAR